MKNDDKLHKADQSHVKFGKMNKFWKAAFVVILVASIYHFVRDLLQTVDLDSALTDIAHRPHQWCGKFCDVVTIPFDIISIVAAAIVLKRNRIGILGWLLIASLPLWLLLSLLP